MTAPTEGTGVALRGLDALAEQRAKHIAEIKQRNAHAAAIRGTQWGKESDERMVKAVAHYCTMHGLDPARHVEVLGARIYLTGELYEEKGAPLVLSGKVVVSAPQFVHHDQRLVEQAKSDDPTLAAWAKAEHIRRIQARIELGIPDDATGACVIRAKVGATELVGFNWCGGKTKVKTKRDGTTYRGDPVGDAEPTKTAQSRAKRRMWRQIVVALPEYAQVMGTMEVSAKVINGEIEDAVDAEVQRNEVAPGGTPSHPTPLISAGEDGYGTTDRTAEDEAFELELARKDGAV